MIHPHEQQQQTTSVTPSGLRVTHSSRRYQEAAGEANVPLRSWFDKQRRAAICIIGPNPLLRDSYCCEVWQRGKMLAASSWHHDEIKVYLEALKLVERQAKARLDERLSIATEREQLAANKAEERMRSEKPKLPRRKKAQAATPARLPRGQRS